MPATIRDVTTDAWTNATSRNVPAPATRPGDVILLIHSADLGLLDLMGVSGGGWTLLATRPADGSLGGGTKIYRRTATSGEPDTYQVTNAAILAGNTVTVIAIAGASATGIVVTQAGSIGPLRDVTTPAATPTTGSGIDIRYAVAYGAGSSATVDWEIPTGYTPGRAAQSRSYVASTFASRALVSSAQVGAQTIRASRNAGGVSGFTLLVPAGGSAPTPPAIPEAAPIRGSSLYRYTVHDLLTGAYMGDIQPTGVTFDRRIGEPGTFSATLPIANQREADKIARLIPRVGSDLTAGPGRITVRIWRAGVLWGEYWITGALISQNRRGNVSVQLRGSTLEAFLNNVPVETSLFYSGDQIANARSLLTHMQGLPGANIGLQLQSGTSGVTRTLEANLEDDPFYGEVLAEYAQQYNGFEYTIDPVEVDGVVERHWRWGYPRLSSDTVHVVSQSPHGGDILEWTEEVDALRGATRIRVRGGTPEVEDAEEGAEPVYSSWTSATSHLSAGWPRYGQRIDHPGESTSTSALNNYALRWISTFAGAVRVYSCTVALGRASTLSPSALGDSVRRIMVNPWFPRTGGAAGFNQTQRLIGIAITPASRETGKEEADLILEEPQLPATSGDRYPNEQRRHIRRLQRDVDRLSSEAKRVRGVPVPTANDVSNPPNFSSPSVQSGEYASGSAYTALRADAANLHDAVRNLMNALRAGGVLR